ncbi:homolog 1 [Octopus vulgaris]|uniref:Homolog 1 n=1 Tax=Octopus vulgaris TaxID=6645 RepID=A0AA36BXS4_OCTVU|nr:homolog 1 [Octopus vulgaris]
MTTLKALPSDTIRLIGSTQVITSVSNAIKELVENSIDAGATNIQVKLENHGLDRIEIRDNGCGIKSEDFPCLAKRHCTSKICRFTDLEELVTYGFRGEALASLSSVSDLTVTSRTMSNSLAQTASFSKSGDVLKITPCSSNEGSTIIASGLFRNLPVRHQFNKNDKRCKEELKRVENLITAFSIINPATRFTLRHNKDILLEKGAVDSYRSALIATWGWSLVQQFEHIVNTDEEHQISLEMFLPQTKSDVNVMSRTGSDQGLVYINRRPVRFKAIQKVVRQYYCNSLVGDKNRYPLFVAIFTVPNREVDVNLEPNKARVLLHNEDIILDILTTLLERLYGVLGSGNQVTKNGSNHTSTETKPKTENGVIHCPKNNKPIPEKTNPSGIELRPPSTFLQPQAKSSLGLTNGNLHPMTDRHNSSPNSTSLPKPAESDTAPTLPVNQPVVIPHQPPPLLAASSSTVNSCTALDREELFKEFDKSFEIEFTNPGSNLGKSSVQQQQPADTGRPQTTSEPQLPLPGPLDLEEWSRGKVGTLNGNLLQPVRLLSSAAGQTSSKPQTILQLKHQTTTPASTPQHPLQAKKKPFLPKPADQMRLYDLVGSQPIKRPITAFNMFCNETQAKLLQKDAEINNDVLRATITAKWQLLPEPEKSRYEKLCEADLKSKRNLKYQFQRNQFSL